jgi:hypothetical protein
MAYELLTGQAAVSTRPSLPAMMEQHFRGAVPSVVTAAGASLAGRPRRACSPARLAKEPGGAAADSAQALIDELSSGSLDRRARGGAGGRGAARSDGSAAAGLAVVAARRWRGGAWSAATAAIATSLRGAAERRRRRTEARSIATTEPPGAE